MIVQVPSRRQGLALFLFSILFTVLAAGPAMAIRDMQVATEGDPGDGNLSPTAYYSSGNSSGGALAGSSTDILDPGLDNTRISVSSWLVPVAGTPFIFPGQVGWFFLNISTATQDHAPFILQAGGGYSYAR